MATLNSPGVAVTVIDESFYVPAAPGTVPLIVVATAQDKLNAAGTGTATATTKAKAGQVQLVTSQKDIGDLFGTPFFETDASNNPIHAGERNEYGLQAAYSLLGVSNRAYIVRADLDLGQLKASGAIPAGAPADGQLWLDTSQTAFGVFEWNGNPATTTGGQAFGVESTYVITDPLKVVSYPSNTQPLASIGAQGDYAVVSVTNLNKLWYKKPLTSSAAGTWVEVGTGAWAASWPTAIGTINNSSITLLSGDTITINGTQITGVLTLTALITAINANSTINTSGITAANINGFLNLYSTGTSVVIGGSGIPTKVGLAAGTYLAPKLSIAPHTQIPTYGSVDNPSSASGYPTGSLWVKTTQPNQGANWFIKKYSAATAKWTTLSTNLYATNQAALADLDPLGGGINLAKGQLYIKYDDAETADVLLANFKVYERLGAGKTDVTSVAVTTGTFVAGSNTFTISD